MTIKRAKAMTWDWSFLESIPEDAQCIKLTTRQIVFLMTVFQQSYWSTRWINQPEDFGDVEAWVADVQTAILSPINCDGVPPPPPPPQKIIEYVGGLIELDESEDDFMGRLTVEILDGVAYLVDDCGCGVLKRYRLQEAQVDPNSGAIGQSYDNIPDGTLPVDAGAALDCYWTAAANIIIEQISLFIDGVAQYFITPTLNAFLGTGVEAAQIVNAILNGNANLNFTTLGVTSSEVKTALTTQGYRDWVAEKLEERELDGQLTRWNLGRLTQFEIPSNLSFPTPVLPYINYWGLFANLQELNDKLSVAATQCRTGFNPSVTDGWEIDLTLYSDESQLPFIINDNGGGQLGYLDPFVGLRPSNVSQWSLWISWEMPVGLNIEQVGYRVAEGGMGGNPFLRSICNYDATGCSGPAVNISGIGEQNVASASVTTDGAGIYFNALTSDAIAFDRLRIKFTEDVSMPVGWTPYAFT